MTGEEASLLCIMAQGRHLMQDVRIRESLLDSLTRSTTLVQNVGGLILGAGGTRPTGRHRRLAAAFIAWADSLPSQIEQAAQVEKQAEKALQRRRSSRKPSKPSPTLWERVLTDEL